MIKIFVVHFYIFMIGIYLFTSKNLGTSRDSFYFQEFFMKKYLQIIFELFSLGLRNFKENYSRTALKIIKFEKSRVINSAFWIKVGGIFKLFNLSQICLICIY